MYILICYSVMHTLIAAKNVSCSANLLPIPYLCPNPNGMDANGFIYLLSTWFRNHLSCLNDIESLKLSRFVPDIPQCTTTVVCKYIIKAKNWHFHVICVPTFIRDISEWKKKTISRDVIYGFICSTTSFYGKGYYYHSKMSRMNAGPQ